MLGDRPGLPTLLDSRAAPRADRPAMAANVGPASGCWPTLAGRQPTLRRRVGARTLLTPASAKTPVMESLAFVPSDYCHRTIRDGIEFAGPVPCHPCWVRIVGAKAEALHRVPCRDMVVNCVDRQLPSPAVLRSTVSPTAGLWLTGPQRLFRCVRTHGSTRSHCPASAQTAISDIASSGAWRAPARASGFRTLRRQVIEKSDWVSQVPFGRS